MVGTTGDVKEPSGHESKISAHLKSHEDELGWSIQMNRDIFMVLWMLKSFVMTLT